MSFSYRPMDPMYLMSFLPQAECDKATLKCMTKALQKYQKAVAKAAENLDSDLKKCKIIKKPKTTKKSK